MREVLHRQLLELARRAARGAYCPYSQFPVGAALWGEDGFLVTGANVENASYGLTLCAERAAIVAAATLGMRRLQAIAVACVNVPIEAPASSRMPCGACRQVIAEFASPQTEILIDGVGIQSIEQLLPGAFVLGRDPSPATQGPRRLLFRLEPPPRLPPGYTTQGPGRLFAVISPDAVEAEAYALSGVHALVWKGRAGPYTHACANWDQVWTYLEAFAPSGMS
jgi:cytidine deaminase